MSPLSAWGPAVECYTLSLGATLEQRGANLPASRLRFSPGASRWLRAWHATRAAGASAPRGSRAAPRSRYLARSAPGVSLTRGLGYLTVALSGGGPYPRASSVTDQRPLLASAKGWMLPEYPRVQGAPGLIGFGRSPRLATRDLRPSAGAGRTAILGSRV